MAGKNLDYWYDEQIRRYLLQIIRVFSHFKVKENTKDGVKYNRVPARYGDSSRMVASILRNNSENALNNAPMIAVSIQSLKISRNRAQDPFLVDTRQVAEREWNSDTGQYTSEQGNLYTTQRYMPVPYDLTIQVDIWTTNTDTKLQLLEQMFVLFNPSIQLQSNDNPLDWSSVFELEMTDITWSSRSIPAGVDESLDIATLTFEVPIWISPPAKVKRQTIIQQIIADVHSTNSITGLGFSSAYDDFFGPITDTSEVVVTPNDYRVQITGANAFLVDNAGNKAVWRDIIEMAGIMSATSLLKLNTSNDSDSSDFFVIGGVAYNPTDTGALIFNIDRDTLPSNTLPDIDKIIDPRTSSPGSGGLPTAELGQRYLITESIAPGIGTWNVDANENDIIQYDGAEWNVVFNSTSITNVQYVTNNYTMKQYKWTGSAWISSWEGEYNPGYWRLVL